MLCVFSHPLSRGAVLTCFAERKLAHRSLSSGIPAMWQLKRLQHSLFLAQLPLHCGELSLRSAPLGSFANDLAAWLIQLFQDALPGLIVLRGAQRDRICVIGVAEASEECTHSPIMLRLLIGD